MNPEKLLQIINAAIDYAERRGNNNRLDLDTIRDYNTAMIVLMCLKNGIEKVQNN